MSRENLFKAKSKDDGRWYEGYYMCLHDTTHCTMPSDDPAEAKRLEEENTHHYIVFERMTDWELPNQHLRVEILPETLCRYTDLTDKNGKKIWENDIVAHSYTVWADVLAIPPKYEIEHKKKNYVIKWDCTASYMGYRYHNGRNIFPFKWGTVYNGNDEVIGNIFDNPELLKGE